MHPIKGYSISTAYRRAGRLWSLGYHTGVDYACPTGTPVYAAADGKIISARWDNSYGNFILVEHRVGGRAYRAYYCHLSKFERKSGSVKAGTLIGRVGATGNVTGPHLHFEVRVSPYSFSARTIVNPSVLYGAKGSGASTNKMDPAAYFVGASGAHVTWLGQRLIAHGYGRYYSVGAGPNFTATDKKAVQAFQKAQGWKGTSADGLPGAQTLKLLAAAPKAPKPSAIGKKHAKTYVITASVLNGREKPSPSAKVLGTHKKGVRFKTDYISNDGKWVRSASNKRWLALEYLKEVKATDPKPPATTTPKPPEGGPKPPLEGQPGSKLTILPRSAWTDKIDARDDALDPAKVVAMTLHWPADPRASMDGLSTSQVAELLRAWWKHHTSGNGWKDIGYNYAVDMEGRCWDLTGDDVGAHASAAGNPTSIGVVLVLGAKDDPSPEMVETVNALYSLKRAKFPKMSRFQGHQQVPGNSTACPGPSVMRYLAGGRFAKPSGSTTTPRPTRKTFRIATMNMPDPTKLAGDAGKRIDRMHELLSGKDLDAIGLQELVGRRGAGKPSDFAADVAAAFGKGWRLLVPTTDHNENYWLVNTATVDVEQHPDAIIRGTLSGRGIPGRHVSLITATSKAGLGEIDLGNTHLVNDDRPAAEVQAGLAASALAKVGTARPRALLGDFNTSGPLSSLASAGLRNARLTASATTNRDVSTYQGKSRTKPASDSKWIIDGVWASSHFGVTGYTVETDLSGGKFRAPLTSDHLPVVVALQPKG